MPPPPKKARYDALDDDHTPPVTGLLALPPTLQASVFDFLAGDDYYHGNGRHYWSQQLTPLPTLAQVSKQWHVMVDEPASLRVLSTLRFRYKDRGLTTATRSEMLAMRTMFILRRSYLRRTILEDLPGFGDIGEGVWSAALSHVPRLQSLDMDTGDVVRPPSRRVLDVTRAAAKQCPLLQSLMFPASMRKPDRHSKYMREFTDEVFKCLPAWSKHGGLRHLRMTMREYIQGRKRLRTYLDTITTHCPNLEIFDGFASAVMSIEMVTCEEAWYVDLESWERFSSTCTQLKLFDWVTVPFATRFFEIFAATPKLQLTNLTFSTSAVWIWKKYFATVDPSTKAALEATGYGGTATNAHLVLQACPNLKEVRVEWFDYRRRNVARSSSKFYINPEIFGDDFCEALARHCKALSKLHHGPVPTDDPKWSPPSIVSLTDHSLHALAKLPELNWVEIVGANITADGLFDLVIHHAASTRQERVYYFSLGDTTENEDTSMVFYNVLQGFLDRLLAFEEELPCAHRPVMLELENANKTILEEGWSAAYFATVQLTIEKLQKKYPTLQFSGIVRDYDEEYGVVKRVVEFAFATESAQLPDWGQGMEEIDAADDEIHGGVFISRRYFGLDMDLPGAPGSRREDDDDDSEDDEDESVEDASSDDYVSDEDDDGEEDEYDSDDFGFGDGDEILIDDDDDVVEFSEDEDDDISDEEDEEEDM